jgi:hypothetical protein
METSVAWLEERDAATIRLDATPLGQPLYETLGFAPEYWLSRFHGAPRIAVEKQSHSQFEITPVAEESWPACWEFDRRHTGADRRELLRYLFQEQPANVRAVRRGGAVAGYLTSRPGRIAEFVGPCIAADDDTGAALLDDALRGRIGMQVFADVIETNAAATMIVSAAGLSVSRRLLRMRRGPASSENSAALWLSSGPEKG